MPQSLGEIQTKTRPHLKRTAYVISKTTAVIFFFTTKEAAQG